MKFSCRQSNTKNIVIKSARFDSGNAILNIIDCGTSNYRDILQLQLQLHEKRLNDFIPNTILIVEHPAVITLGARQSANKLLQTYDEIKKKGIDIVEIRRGGGTTAHNPGQLVFYPILNLKTLKLGISEYIRKLEQIGSNLLKKLDINSSRRKHYPGLWIEDKKIASIGVRVSKFITYHGMAINIQNDLDIFDLLIPCGLDNVEMTSVLTETGTHHSMKMIKEDLAELLRENFNTIK